MNMGFCFIVKIMVWTSCHNLPWSSFLSITISSVMFAKYQTENWDWEDLRRLSMKKLNMWNWLFVLFMFQQQYGYLVIQMLMSHLDTHTNSDPSIKASIIEVLYESVLISAGGSIGREIYKNILIISKHSL